MTLSKDLLAIEEEIWTGGPEAYQKHMDEKCLVAFKDMSGLISRKEIMKAAEKGRWTNVTLNEKGTIALSAATMIITYECTANRQDGKPYHALVSSGYVKRGEGWKLEFHHHTPLEIKKLTLL